MKRLVVLLVVLAGGLAAAVFAIPTNAASVNGVSISQEQLNTDLSAIAASSDYQCYLMANEAVDGGAKLPTVAGAAQFVDGTNPTVTTSFAANYLSTLIDHQLVLGLAAKMHLQATPQEVLTARAELADQINAILQDVAGSQYACAATGQTLTGHAVLLTLPSTFVKENAQFDATVNVLEETLSGVGSSTGDLERYFAAHKAAFDTACFTVAGYSSVSDAQNALKEVASGTPFAQVAAQVNGGPRGCVILNEVASELPPSSNIGRLALNSVSQPIADGGEYLLLEITSKVPTSFATARVAVESAVESAGAGRTRVLVSAAEKQAVVWVDHRYGRWVPAEAQILPPRPPPQPDVLKPAVNSAGTKVSATSASSSGQTP